MKKLKIILIVFIVLVLLIFAATAKYVYSVSKTLPNVSSIVENYAPVIPTVIYDQNGKVIDRLFKENRKLVNINNLPKFVPNAFVAIEDRTFYTNHGFNVIRIIKSAFIDLILRKYAEGASTITQQLARNAFLNMRKTIKRKVQEAIITVELERDYTKKEILNKYINVIYFGSGVYGVQAASMLYFGIPAKNLTIGESAFLAGIPNSPTYYNPLRHYKHTVTRQKLVLYQMRKYHFITQKQYEKAIKQKIILSPSYMNTSVAPEFLQIVKRKLLKMYTPKEIYTQGLKVYTSLNLGMQKAARYAFKTYDRLKKYKKMNGALITINSHNGYVEAIIGGRDYKAGDFDRATQAYRQPGSSFKPFLYITALLHNYQMNMLLEDSPITINGWTPTDFSPASMTNKTLLAGLGQSINIIAVKLLQFVGFNELFKTTKKIGFVEKLPRYPSIVLGSVAVTPFQQAMYYLPFSNCGYRVKPVFITTVKDRYGNTLYRYKPEKVRIFPSKYVALLTFMLKDVVKHGTGIYANVGIPQAGKTGTTNGTKSAWFVGYTPQFVTAVYMGHDNHTKMQGWMTGGMVSAPLWGKYVWLLLKRGIYKSTKFKYLQNAIKSGELVERNISDINGLLATSKTPKADLRKALFLNGYYPIQSAGAYNGGLTKILNSYKNYEKEKYLY